MSRICYFLFGFKTPFYLHWALLAFIFYKPISRALKSKYLRLILISLPALFFFLKAVRGDYYFLADDFAHLHLVSNYSFVEIARMAVFRGIWVGHRIVVGFWIFKLIFLIFGTNIYPYLVTVFLVNWANVLLLYFLLEKLRPRTNISVLIAFLFGGFYLSWISNLHEILGALFVLSALNAWIIWLQGKNKKFFYLTIIFYLLAVFTKEITFLLPAGLVSLNIFKEKKPFYKLLPLLIIFFFYTLFFASKFLGFFGLEGGGYTMSFSLPVIFRNLFYYLKVFLPGINPILTGLFLIFVFFKSPFFVLTSFLFLFPALLFSDVFRQTPYYLYISSIFIFIALFLVFKNLRGKKLFNIYFVILVLFYLFQANLPLMNSCFLIQFPQGNSRRHSLEALIGNIQEKGAGEYQLDLDTELSIVEPGLLPLFMGNKAQDFSFTYNKEKGILEVNAK